MEMIPTVKMPVRALVEFVLRSGDLASGFMGSSRQAEGIKAHQHIQKTSTEDYQPEVFVSYVCGRDGLNMEISGRIDGVINSGGNITIDEIKSTTAQLEDINEDYNHLHWAQAKCYAFIYCTRNNLSVIDVRLTYFQLDTKDIKYFEKTFAFEELKAFFDNLIDRYLEWANLMQDWSYVRDMSIKALEFPYENYRKGQRELAVSVYRTIRDSGKLFAQAPTGIGKTIATLFPTVKALGEGLTSKIFYLTAKTITRTIAEKALDNMRSSGLRIKSLTITAKDKVCFKPESSCSPDECEFARGYYDRVNDAIRDAFATDALTRDVIVDCARQYRVCPFELSLDMSLWSDCIICDYNYVFDPRVYLKRFFMDGGGDFTFLIDEAHNLVDRSREMYSAELFKKPVLELKRLVKAEAPKLSKCLDKINSFMIDARKLCEEEENNFHIQKAAPKELYPLLRNFIRMSEKWLLENEQSPIHEKLLDFYFEVTGFLRTSEQYDERYVTYCEKSNDDVKIKLFCLDPSYLLEEAMKRGKSAVLFSATLTPMDYFVKLLGGAETSNRLRLASPFPRENLCLLINDRVSTKYKVREQSYEMVAKLISVSVSGKTGNYLVFFPSYQYMNEVYLKFVQLNPGLKVIYQRNGMTEKEREEFLDEFSEPGENSLVGFAVMGGIFGEGIDLVGDRLSGAVIVGVGLPQICLEREIIREYFEEQKGVGFEYAYTFPGMNKVLQAVGRVIRTERDKGMVLLIDERFSYSIYEDMYPPEWQPLKVRDLKSLGEALEEFWS